MAAMAVPSADHVAPRSHVNSASDGVSETVRAEHVQEELDQQQEQQESSQHLKEQPMSKRPFLVELPQGAVPGETKLSINVEGGESLIVKVPIGAVPGDKLQFTLDGDGVWKCSLVRAAVLPSDPVNQTFSLLVPAEVNPGSSKIEFDVAGSKMSLAIPKEARPGDKMILQRDKEGSSGSMFKCLANREKMIRCDALDVFQTPRPLKRVASDNEEMTNLSRALEAVGCFVSPKLRRGRRPPLDILGVVAAEPIEAGEVLCRVHGRLHMSPDTVQAHFPEEWSKIAKLSENEVVPESRLPDILHCIILARLLHSAAVRASLATGEASPGARVDEGIAAALDPLVLNVWERYADVLLHEDFPEHPFRLAGMKSSNIQEGMAPSLEADYLIDMAQDVFAVHKKCSTSGFGEDVLGPCFELETFLRARLCIMSRVFQTNADSTLVPGVDFFNHAEKPTALWRWVEKENAMVVTACCAHAVGEEVLVSYGPRSNTLFYRTYGFTQHPKVEPVWHYFMTSEQAHAVYQEYLAEEDHCLSFTFDSKHLDPSLCKVMNAVTANGKRTAEFLQLVTARCKINYERGTPKVERCVQALGRARAKDPTSYSWWAELDESDTALQEDNYVRIAMSQYLALVTFWEAVNVFLQKFEEDKCLAGTEAVRKVFCDALRALETRGNFILHVTDIPLDE
eukprot:TRINITY_DN69503_c0_g1_i1.p1 TRINITY_DN69503_c0_g1~~TRINITY_DN69503_c0_g1_i1.p1  ORF type:complete len:699 (-),score=117.67 TRINITY_DN69503_c0_g1_i1:72-2117(-)